TADPDLDLVEDDGGEPDVAWWNGKESVGHPSLSLEEVDDRVRVQRVHSEAFARRVGGLRRAQLAKTREIRPCPGELPDRSGPFRLGPRPDEICDPQADGHSGGLRGRLHARTRFSVDVQRHLGHRATYTPTYKSWQAQAGLGYVLGGPITHPAVHPRRNGSTA